MGLLVGSFLNVLILRLPVMMQRAWVQEIEAFTNQPAMTELIHSEPILVRPDQPPVFNLFVPRSHCPQCKTKLSGLHLVPVISWICLRGRCAHCQTVISARYPMIELLTGFLSVAVAMKWGLSETSLAALFFIWTLIALAFIDIDTLLLPDSLTQPLLWLGLILNSYGIFSSFEAAFWGAVIGYLSLWVLYWGFRIATGKEGIGQGDFKLLAALGAWLGWQALPGILLFASVTGAGYGLLAMWILRHSRQTPIPFGPFLALGGGVLLFYPLFLGALIP